MLVFRMGDDLNRLWVRRWDDPEAFAIRGTEGGGAPDVSHDGERVAFVQGNDLAVIDTATGERRKLTNDGSEDILNGKLDWVYQEEVYGRGRFKGFWWSPDGEHLAVMVPVGSTGDVRWLLWNRDESFVSDSFTPTPLFARSYAPFFDQFHQTVTPWSPDGSWLVYTGFDDTGEPAAFVLEAAVGAEPQRIASDAAVAFWSPL